MPRCGRTSVRGAARAQRVGQRQQLGNRRAHEARPVAEGGRAAAVAMATAMQRHVTSGAADWGRVGHAAHFGGGRASRRYGERR